MTDITQEFLNEFKNELKSKDGFSDDVINSFDKYFNEKFIRGNEEKVIEESLQNNNFITSDVMEAVNSVLYDKQNIGVITKFIGKYNDNDNDNYNHNPTAEYFNNQYTGYTTNNGKVLLTRIKNKNQGHYTADLIDADGNVIYNIDSNGNSIEDDKAYIGTQINNNCCIHAFEQTLMLQDLVQFYHNKNITRPALKEFIKKAIEKLKEDGVFQKKEKDEDKDNSNSHFTKLRKEICKIYALTKFLDSKEKELQANGNYNKIKNYRNTLYDKLLDEKSKVNFANYLDFKKGLENYNKVTDIDGDIETSTESQLKKDENQKNILQFLNKAPDNLEEAKKCIKCFEDLKVAKIGELDDWKLKIFIDGASKYICESVQHEDLLTKNLEIVKQLYKIISQTDEIKKKLGDKKFNDVEFNLTRATTYITELNKLVKVDNVGQLTDENIQKVYKDGNVVTDNNENKYIFHKNDGNIKTDILAQLTNNKNTSNFNFIDIKKDIYKIPQLTQEEFNEILNNDNFKTIAKEVGEDANFLFYNKLKSLGIVSKDVSVNFGEFKFQKHVNNLFPENSKYCLVDAGNDFGSKKAGNFNGTGVNEACRELLNNKFNIKVEEKVKNIHSDWSENPINCGNNCEAQCVSQDKVNKVTLLKFYKKEEDGKQKDGIFILYVTGPNFSEDENNKTPNGYKNRVTKGMQTLENTLNSMMNTISNPNSTLSLNDTIIFGGISNVAYAGTYQNKQINGEFNVIDLFNALVYKVKSKDEPPVCNVSFTWGVAKAIDFVNELDKAGKEINIEADILDKFGFNKEDEVYKYLEEYIKKNFNNIFSKAKKAETPKREGEDAGSSSVAPSQSEMGGSTSGSGTPSQSEMGGSTSGSIPTQSSLVGGSSTPSSSISTPSVNTSASNSVIPTSKASASAPSGSIAVNSTQQDFQGPPPPPELLKKEIVEKLASILIKKEPRAELFNELKNNGIITEEGKLADGQGGNWVLIVEKAKEIYKKESKKGSTLQEQLKIKGQYKTQEQINNLSNYFDNPENVIGKDGSVNFAKVSTNKGNPQNPPKDPVDKPPFSTKLNPVSNKTNKFDEKPSPAKTMGVVPKNQNSPDVILRDLSSKVNELMKKISGEYKTFEIKHPQGNGLLDYLQKARDNNVELTEEIANDIQKIWDKEVTIGEKTQTIQEHMSDELVEYISSFSKKNQGLEEHQEPQAQKEEEKQNLETEIKDKQTEINSLIKEIKEDKSIDDEKKLNEKKKKVEKLITELKVSKQKFETDYPDEQNAEIKNINIDNLSNNLNKTVNVISKKLKVEKQQSKTQNTNKEDNKIQQEEGKKEQHSSQQQETKTNNINTNTNTNTTAKLKGTAEQIKKQNELYKFFMIWYCFQMMMMAQQRNNIVQQNMRR